MADFPESVLCSSPSASLRDKRATSENDLSAVVVPASPDTPSWLRSANDGGNLSDANSGKTMPSEVQPLETESRPVESHPTHLAPDNNEDTDASVHTHSLTECKDAKSGSALV